MSVTHWQPGVSFIEDEEGWRVQAGCGEVLYSDNGLSDDWTSEHLSEVDCPKCREVYSLEILAEVP